MKRYICIGDFVRSRHDGQTHYVSAYRVMKLYGLDPKVCKLIDSEGQLMSHLHDENDDVVVLRPDSTGRYKLDP